MPYKKGRHLPGERASRLGHLEVLKSPLINQICSDFDDDELVHLEQSKPQWLLFEDILVNKIPLSNLWASDGSWQTLNNNEFPYKSLVFVKTALIKLNGKNMNFIDPDYPHPFDIKKLLDSSASYHATVFPLRNVNIRGMNNYDAIRQILFESMKDPSLDGAVFETLKWLLYGKWNPNNLMEDLTGLSCPHCEGENAELKYDSDIGICKDCHNEILLTDALGFHLDMNFEYTSAHIAEWYGIIHELLFLLSAIRMMWENDKKSLSTSLFVKDGPFTLYRQYSKLNSPIRKFLSYAQSIDCPVFFIGQEKTGMFVDHLMLIERDMPKYSMFIPDDAYIKRYIHQNPKSKGTYGEHYNYGVKIFVKLDDFQTYVLNVPVLKQTANPTYDDLIGIDEILSTLPTILSSKYENALMPIEIANNIASLSVYPSTQILKRFLEESKKEKPSE